MTSLDQKIRTVVCEVLGDSSPLFSRVVAALEDELQAARENGAALHEKKFLAGLGAASVIAALSVAAKPTRRARRVASHAINEISSAATPPPLPPGGNIKEVA